MERLTKRITENQIELSAKANPKQYVNSPQRVHMKHPFWNVFNRLEEYEDLEEQKLLLRLPCKVGTTIYVVNHYWIDEGLICGIAECDDVDCACFKVYEDPDTYTMVAFYEFGITWFLSREEAEAKLREL